MACGAQSATISGTNHAANNEPQQVTFTIQPGLIILYDSFTKGRDPLTIDDFTGIYSRRDIVDIVIVQQALHLGGFNAEVTFQKGNYYAKNLQLLSEGKLAITVDSVWLSDLKEIENDVYISQPVIRNGEYVAGLYTEATNDKVLAVKTLKSLQSLSAVSSKNWSTDWNTLQALNFAKLSHQSDWRSMSKMVAKRWIDVMLMTFPVGESIYYTDSWVKLKPIPNIKVVLKDSRHFAVSKKHRQGAKLYAALDKGLTKLRQRGIIKKAYTECGLFHPAVENWQIINQ